MAEGLSGLMRKAKWCNLFDGFDVGNKNCEINFLQYVHDTIFVGDVRAKNVFTIKAIHILFELISGLRVNFHKSSFGAIRIEDVVVERYASLLNLEFFISLSFT